MSHPLFGISIMLCSFRCFQPLYSRSKISSRLEEMTFHSSSGNYWSRATWNLRGSESYVSSRVLWDPEASSVPKSMAEIHPLIIQRLISLHVNAYAYGISSVLLGVYGLMTPVSQSSYLPNSCEPVTWLRPLGLSTMLHPNSSGVSNSQTFEMMAHNSSLRAFQLILDTTLQPPESRSPGLSKDPLSHVES
jgi:hypothetical protein